MGDASLFYREPPRRDAVEVDSYNLPITGPKATEPARLIARAFADQKMVKTFIVALVAMVSGILKVTIDDAMTDNIFTVVWFMSMLATPVVANSEQSAKAIDQGEVTRKAVYSPASVVKIRDAAYEAGKPITQPKPDIPPPTIG